MDPRISINYWVGNSQEDQELVKNDAKNLYVKMEKSSDGTWKGTIKKTDSPKWLAFKHAIIEFFSNFSYEPVEYYHGKAALNKIQSRPSFFSNEQLDKIKNIRKDLFILNEINIDNLEINPNNVFEHL